MTNGANTWGVAGVTGSHDMAGTLQSLSGDLSCGRPPLCSRSPWSHEQGLPPPITPSHPHQLSWTPHWSLKHCNPLALLPGTPQRDYGTILSPILMATPHLTLSLRHAPLYLLTAPWYATALPLFALILGDFNTHRYHLPTLRYPQLLSLICLYLPAILSLPAIFH